MFSIRPVRFKEPLVQRSTGRVLKIGHFRIKTVSTNHRPAPPISFGFSCSFHHRMPDCNATEYFCVTHQPKFYHDRERVENVSHRCRISLAPHPTDTNPKPQPPSQKQKTTPDTPHLKRRARPHLRLEREKHRGGGRKRGSVCARVCVCERESAHIRAECRPPGWPPGVPPRTWPLSFCRPTPCTARPRTPNPKRRARSLSTERERERGCMCVCVCVRERERTRTSSRSAETFWLAASYVATPLQRKQERDREREAGKGNLSVSDRAWLAFPCDHPGEEVRPPHPRARHLASRWNSVNYTTNIYKYKYAITSNTMLVIQRFQGLKVL